MQALGPVALVSLLLNDGLTKAIPGSDINDNPNQPKDPALQAAFNHAAIQARLLVPWPGSQTLSVTCFSNLYELMPQGRDWLTIATVLCILLSKLRTYICPFGLTTDISESRCFVASCRHHTGSFQTRLPGTDALHSTLAEHASDFSSMQALSQAAAQ